MKNLKTLLIAMIFSLAAAPAAEAGSTFQLRGRLNRQLWLIGQIRPHVERLDLPSVLVLERSTQRTLESLQERGAANTLTLQRFQELVIGYRFSKDLFKQIGTEMTAVHLKELQGLAAQIAETTGLDESPYTTMTLSVYEQIYQLILRLEKLELPQTLQEALRNLRMPLGKLLALAKNGDHYETFQRAAEVQRQITGLYPLFESVAANDAAFYVVLEIQGLNEFYAQFSQLPASAPIQQPAREGVAQ